MDPADIAKIVIVFVLVFLSMFFSSAETALCSANKIRMRSMAEEGSKKAQRVLQLMEEPSKMLGMILIGNNLVNLSASSLTTSLAISIWGNYAVGIATGILTFLILIFGEILPKTIATLYTDRLALVYSGIIWFLIKIFNPIVVLVNGVANGIMRLLGIDKNKRETQMTESELRTIVDVSHEEGVIESEERRMITNVVDFGDSYAKDVMVPRVDMNCLDIDATYDEMVEAFNENKYSRLPIYEESRDNIIGILHLKDVFFQGIQEQAFDLRKMMRDPFYTYEYKKTSELLIEMREKRISVAIVLDEYGAAVGMVTLEDLLEEIVGEIRDEYDEDEEEPIQKISDSLYRIDGVTKLEDVNEALGLDLSSEEYDSIAGYVICLLDHLPERGETVEEDGIRFTAEAVEKNRIDKVLLEILPDKEK